MLNRGSFVTIQPKLMEKRKTIERDILNREAREQHRKIYGQLIHMRTILQKLVYLVQLVINKEIMDNAENLNNPQYLLRERHEKVLQPLLTQVARLTEEAKDGSLGQVLSKFMIFLADVYL